MTIYITKDNQIRYKLSIVGNQLIFQTNSGELMSQTGLEKGLWDMHLVVPDKKPWWRFW